jgi:hypothetical protein
MSCPSPLGRTGVHGERGAKLACLKRPTGCSCLSRASAAGRSPRVAKQKPAAEESESRNGWMKWRGRWSVAQRTGATFECCRDRPTRDWRLVRGAAGQDTVGANTGTRRHSLRLSLSPFLVCVLFPFLVLCVLCVVCCLRSGWMKRLACPSRRLKTASQRTRHRKGQDRITMPADRELTGLSRGAVVTPVSLFLRVRGGAA